MILLLYLTHYSRISISGKSVFQFDLLACPCVECKELSKHKLKILYFLFRGLYLFSMLENAITFKTNCMCLLFVPQQ